MESTSNFLSMFPWCLLVSYDEITDIKKTYRTISIDDIEEENSQRNKRWIFFTPNGDFESEIKAAEAKTFQCFAIDIPTKSRIREGLVEPSIIVETKNGTQLYFMLDKKYDYEAYKDAYKKITSQMSDMLMTDGKCSDISRLMRVVWTKYRKDNLGDFVISATYTDATYTISDMLNIFDPNDWLNEYWDERESRTRYNEVRSLFDEIEELDAWYILEKIWQWFVVNTDGTISKDWEVIPWYIYFKHKNIVYNIFKEDKFNRPRGNAYTIVKQWLSFQNFYWVVDWIHQNTDVNCEAWLAAYKDIIDRWVLLKKEITKKEDWNVVFGAESAQLFMNYKTKETIFRSSSKKGEVNARFVTWVFEPVGHFKINKRDDGSFDEIKTIIKIISNKGTSISLLRPLSWENDFKKFAMSYWMSAEANKPATSLLIDYLMKDIKEYWYTDRLWLQDVDGKRILVREWGKYILDDNIFVEVRDIKGEQIKKPMNSNQSRKEIADILMELYDPKIILPLFFYATSMVFIRYFRKKWKKLPGLFLEWMKASWKTTIKRIVYSDLLWYKYAINASSTPYVFENSLKHCMAISIEEYRGTWIRNAWLLTDLVRIAHDWQWSIQKWQATLDVISSEIVGQFAFDWQTKFSDWATVSRQIALMTTPHKKWSELALKKLKRDSEWNIQNILWNVLDMLPNTKSINKFMELWDDIWIQYAANINDSWVDISDCDRIAKSYALLWAMCRTMGLDQYEKHIIDVMFDQIARDETDDISSNYNFAFEQFSVYKWMVTFCNWWCFLELNLEMSRMQQELKEDKLSMFKTINEHFWKTWWQWLYIDFSYIYKRNNLKNKFKMFLTHVSFPDGFEWYEDWTRDTLVMLSEFLRTLRWTDGIIQEINSSVNYWAYSRI